MNAIFSDPMVPRRYRRVRHEIRDTFSLELLIS